MSLIQCFTIIIKLLLWVKLVVHTHVFVELNFVYMKNICINNNYIFICFQVTVPSILFDSEDSLSVISELSESTVVLETTSTRIRQDEKEWEDLQSPHDNTRCR